MLTGAHWCTHNTQGPPPCTRGDQCRYLWYKLRLVHVFAGQPAIRRGRWVASEIPGKLGAGALVSEENVEQRPGVPAIPVTGAKDWTSFVGGGEGGGEPLVPLRLYVGCGAGDVT